ncbi:MAG: TAXI family TRAP transporter solute-binding subunit [Rubrivivax sp.]
MDAITPRRSLAARTWEAIVGAGPLVVALMFVGLALASYGAWKVLDPTPTKHLVIAAGPEKGAYIEFAKRYLPLLQAQGVTVALRTTQGSSENLKLLRDAGSGIDAAFLQSGVAEFDADQDKRAIESLGHVAYEPVWLFYSESAAGRLLAPPPAAEPGRSVQRGPRGRPAEPPVPSEPPQLTNLAQLAGWRLNIGPEGGGARPLFKQLLQANQLDADQITFGVQTPVQGALDLVAGRTDAVLMVAAADSPMVRYLLTTPGVKLFEFNQAEAYARRFAFLRATTLPRGIVDLAADRPAHDVRLVAATASLVVRRNLHPALVQLLVQASQQAHREAGWFNSMGEFPNAGASELPLAPEAARFYRDGVPLLQRYLPFWVANFIDRMWIVVLPLVAVMIPLSRVLPPLVTMRLRSRIYRWYANLRAVEHALERPSPPYDALRAEISRIDEQTEHIGVPLSYANELYALRHHVQLVRQRIEDRAASATEITKAADARPPVGSAGHGTAA